MYYVDFLDQFVLYMMRKRDINEKRDTKKKAIKRYERKREA